MELSVAKLNRALEYFIIGENYKYSPSQFMFDYKSDKDYAYIIIDTHYIIRAPKKDLELNKVLEADTLYPAIKRDINIERMITSIMEDKTHVDFKYNGLKEVGADNKELVEFISGDNKKYINPKFFKQYYNHNIIANKIPDNITFSGMASYRQPLIMWENDEAIAVFMPIDIAQ